MPEHSKSPIRSHTTLDGPISKRCAKGVSYQAEITDFTLLVNHAIGNASNENIQTKVTGATKSVTPMIMGELNAANSIVNSGITS